MTIPVRTLSAAVLLVVTTAVASAQDPLPDVAREPAEDAGGAIRLAEYTLRKQAKRQGFFIEAADFPRDARYLSEAFRRVPGAQLRGAVTGSGVRLRGCRPTIWLDGIRMEGLEIDEAAAIGDVAAMEVYPSIAQAPPQYQDRDTRCGSVLIWLR